MIRFLLGMLLLFSAGSVRAQHSLQLKIQHADSKHSLEAATVSIPSLGRNAITDTSGIAVISNLPAGKYQVQVSYTGFSARTVSITIPLTSSPFIIELEPDDEEEEEVIVQSTRTSRNIRDVPTRVEAIELEEIDEKSNMRPGNVSMLLHESTGIQVQQTSATSGNAGIRIQGLDGRYTQLLKDGFPNFGNFASGLSVLEIPPLDLQQVEIIKGPASTLFGGGAIAGVINFISKAPKEETQHLIQLNQSNIGQSNIGYFSSGRNKRIGYTLLAMVNTQQVYDVDKDDFTEVPKSLDWTIHPRVFLYGKRNNTLIIGNSFAWGDREGGDVQVVKGKADGTHQYFEKNKTIRNNTTLEYISKPSEDRRFTAKQSFSIFDRKITIPGYLFDGKSYNSFTDVSWLHNFAKHALVSGANFVYDDFNEQAGEERDNRNLTAGAYIQDTWDASERLKLETGFRLDWARYSNQLFSRSEVFALPRVSLLARLTDKVSSRIGAGMGYKLPTLFTERTESFQYQGIQQLNAVKAERSYGTTADINIRTRIGSDLDFAFNQLFFLTYINKPLVLEDMGGGELRFVNASKPVVSSGFETNAKFIYRHNLKLFLGYTFTNAQANYLPGNQFLPLVPKHKLNSALIYEKHEFIKVGLEAYYTGRQYLFNGNRTSDFWELGFMAEKVFEKFSVYINLENFTDTRQSRFKRVANGSHEQPVFDDIWTHTEGFVVNGGVKIRL